HLAPPIASSLRAVMAPPSVPLRPELARILETLIEESEDTRFVGLDTLAAAIGTLAVSHDEIDAMLDALEPRARRVDSGASRAAVVAAARRLKVELGRAPSPAEVAEASGLPLADVRHALAYVRVLARGR